MVSLASIVMLSSRSLMLTGCTSVSDLRRTHTKSGRDIAVSLNPVHRRGILQVKAQGSHDGNSAPEFYLNDYVEAKVWGCQSTPKHGFAIVMKLVDSDNAFSIFVGLQESDALLKELGGQPSGRPMTHDLMKSTVEALGYKVSKVCVTQLLGNTYFARIHYTKGGVQKESAYEEIHVDARPSDAINLAVRCRAPIYVAKELAAKVADKMSVLQLREKSTEHRRDIVASCRAALSSYDDPTTLLKLDMQLAVANEDYVKAIEIREQVDKILQRDRLFALMVAMETALADERLEEAAQIRDEYLELKREEAERKAAKVAAAIATELPAEVAQESTRRLKVADVSEPQNTPEIAPGQ